MWDFLIMVVKKIKVMKVIVVGKKWCECVMCVRFVGLCVAVSGP